MEAIDGSDGDKLLDWDALLGAAVTPQLCADLEEHQWAMRDNALGPHAANVLLREMRVLAAAPTGFGFKPHLFQFGASAKGVAAPVLFRKPHIFEADLHDTRFGRTEHEEDDPQQRKGRESERDTAFAAEGPPPRTEDGGPPRTPPPPPPPPPPSSASAPWLPVEFLRMHRSEAVGRALQAHLSPEQWKLRVGGGGGGGSGGGGSGESSSKQQQLQPQAQQQAQPQAGTTTKLQRNTGRGGCFPLHYDNPGPPNMRALTCLFYLNPDWQEGDGGELELVPFLPPPSSAAAPAASVTLAPRMDRLVVFRSDTVLHRVLPSLAPERLCFTVWIDALPGTVNTPDDVYLKAKHLGLLPTPTGASAAATDGSSSLVEARAAFFRRSPLQRVVSRAVYAEEYERSLIDCMLPRSSPPAHTRSSTPTHGSGAKATAEAAQAAQAAEAAKDREAGATEEATVEEAGGARAECGDVAAMRAMVGSHRAHVIALRRSHPDLSALVDALRALK